MEKSILNLFHSRTTTFASRVAFSIKQSGVWREMTYRELSDTANLVSEWLMENGFQKGERVAIFSEACPEWAIAFFASIRCGAVIIPLDPKLQSSEVDAVLQEANPSLVFVSRRFQEFLRGTNFSVQVLENICALQPLRRREGVERMPEEVALIVYTSGTTGRPRGVMITFGNLLFQVKTLTRTMGIVSSDVFLSMLPLNHLLELTGGLLCVLFAGGQVCYSQTVYPQEVISLVEEKEITWIVTVPLFLKVFRKVLEKQGSIHATKLRGLICGGAPLDPETAGFFWSHGIPVYQGYGLTETSPVVSVNTPQACRPGSVGKPVEDVEVKISQDGEILVRGPNVMAGYYNMPDKTAEVLDQEGWLHTGDLGELDKDGFLYITGRLKNTIVLGGGKKVQPEEVEAVLSEAANVQELAVLGRVSKEGVTAGTEEVCAVIVPKEGVDGQQAVSEVQRLALQLAPYKRPAKIFIYPLELPKTTTRKIKKEELRFWLSRL